MVTNQNTGPLKMVLKFSYLDSLASKLPKKYRAEIDNFLENGKRSYSLLKEMLR